MKIIQMAMLALVVSTACYAGELIPVDDSYTVSQRYYAYKKDHPELEWPVLEVQSGQRMLFDRLYKKIGNRELHIDVFLPAPQSARRQGILLVHGGGWRSGNKSNFYSMANLLAQRGYVVLIPEFRLSAEAAYPAGLLDINDAIVWAKGRADEFGFDTDKLAIGGESSGGQMAALIAYSSGLNTFKSVPGLDTGVNALVDLDGVLDFTAPLALQYEDAAGDKSMAALWLGGSFKTAEKNWRDASPARYAGADSPPSLIVSGEAPRFTAGRETVESVLDHYHIRHASLAFEHAPHTFWLFNPYLEAIAKGIDDFLQKCGGTSHTASGRH
jgi:acetyl esterase